MGKYHFHVHSISVLIYQLYNCRVTMNSHWVWLKMFVLYMGYTIGGSMLRIYYEKYLCVILCAIFMLNVPETQKRLPFPTSSPTSKDVSCCNILQCIAEVFLLSTIGQKPQRIEIKADKTPKRGNILVHQQSRCTIPFLVM